MCARMDSNSLLAKEIEAICGLIAGHLLRCSTVSRSTMDSPTASDGLASRLRLPRPRQRPVHGSRIVGIDGIDLLRCLDGWPATALLAYVGAVSNVGCPRFHGMQRRSFQWIRHSLVLGATRLARAYPGNCRRLASSIRWYATWYLDHGAAQMAWHAFPTSSDAAEEDRSHHLWTDIPTTRPSVGPRSVPVCQSLCWLCFLR